MTSYFLKIIALITMTIDHAGRFFPNLPIWFHWVGRVSAPLFLFVFVHSLSCTSSRKKLIQRLYFFNIIMCMIGMNINNSSISGIIGEFRNNIFGSFFAISLLIILLESVKNRNLHYKKYIIGYILLQIISTSITIILVYNGWDSLATVCSSLTGNLFFNEGKLFFVLLGVILFYTKKNKRRMAVGFSCAVILNSAVILLALMPKIARFVQMYGNETLFGIFERIAGILGYDIFIFEGLSPFYNHYEWMSLAALPLMLFYNGKRGRSHKMMFYFYYPVHFIFLAICCYLG